MGLPSRPMKSSSTSPTPARPTSKAVPAISGASRWARMAARSRVARSLRPAIRDSSTASGSMSAATSGRAPAMASIATARTALSSARSTFPKWSPMCASAAPSATACSSPRRRRSTRSSWGPRVRCGRKTVRPPRRPYSEKGLLQPECSAQPGPHLLRRDPTVAVHVQRVEDGVGPAPLLAGDEAVAVEIEDAKQIARGIGGVALHLLHQQALQRRLGLGEALDALGQLLLRHPILLVHLAEDALVHLLARDVHQLRRLGIELALQLAAAAGQFREQLGRDGQQIAPGQLEDLAHVAERGAHHLGLVAVPLEIVVDARHRNAARILAGRILGPAGVLEVPVEDATHEGRDESRARFRASDRLVHAEQ